MSFWVCDRLMGCEGVSVFGSLFSRLRLFAEVSVGFSCATAGDSLAALELSAMAGDFSQCVAPEFGLKTRFRVKPAGAVLCCAVLCCWLAGCLLPLQPAAESAR